MAPTPDDKSFLERGKSLNKYMDDVVKPLLPNARIGSTSSFGRPQTIHQHAELKLSGRNGTYANSPYYYRNKKLRFVHYTSVNNLLSILSEGAIRLFNFTSLSDPQELIFSVSDWGDLITKPVMEKLKSQLFSLSMCKYENQEDEIFDLWRLYGNSGKGVGIVFEFDRTNQKDWHHFHLSKLYYGDKHKIRVNELKERHISFHQSSNFHVRGLNEMFSTVLGFHKNSIYKNENEVRLLKYTEVDPISNIPDFSFPTLNNSGKKVYYSKIDLDTIARDKKYKDRAGSDQEMLKRFYRIFPSIKITDIILGYQIDANTAFEISDVVSEITKDSFKQVPKVHQSIYRKIFQ